MMTGILLAQLCDRTICGVEAEVEYGTAVHCCISLVGLRQLSKSVRQPVSEHGDQTKGKG